LKPAQLPIGNFFRKQETNAWQAETGVIVGGTIGFLEGENVLKLTGYAF